MRVRASKIVATMLLLITGCWAANTEKTLFTFTGNTTGTYPYGGVTLDKAGHVYGTALLVSEVTYVCNRHRIGSNEHTGAERTEELPVLRIFASTSPAQRPDPLGVEG